MELLEKDEEDSFWATDGEGQDLFILLRSSLVISFPPDDGGVGPWPREDPRRLVDELLVIEDTEPGDLEPALAAKPVAPAGLLNSFIGVVVVVEPPDLPGEALVGILLLLVVEML